MTVYGYARVSTTLTKNRQHLTLQTDALKAAGCQVIIKERLSGTRTDRPELNGLLDRLQAGDTLVVWKLDRLGRSLTHLTSVVLDQLNEKGVTFVSLTEAIDTRTSQGRLLFGLLGSVAAFERDLIVERVKAGLAASKRKNGRPKAMSGANVKLARRMRDEGTGIPDIARQFGVSRQTVYNYLNEPVVITSLAG